MTFVFILFALSLLGIVALFSLKHFELSRGRILVPELRARGDEQALKLKELAFAARKDFEKFVPELIRLSRVLLHLLALEVAAFARFLERQAHRLADLVSHKRGFERRETRSEFLKKVAEHRSDALDTTNGNGHND